MKTGFKRPLRLAIYLILLILSVVWISFEGGMLSYLTFFALLLQYPVFLIYSLYVNQSLKLHQETPDRHLKKGEAQEFLLVLENSGFLPIGALYLNVENRASYLSGSCLIINESEHPAGKISGLKRNKGIGSSGTKNGDIVGRIEIMPGQRLEKDLKLTCFYAGTYPVGVLSFGITDPFGIFSATFDVPQKFRAIVAPEITDEAGRKLAEELPSAEARFQNKNSSDEILGSDLKKYSPGDRKSSVHWKLYAKTGELYTRLPENRNVGMFTVLLAAEKVREEEIEDLIMRDAFLTLAVSFAYYFAKQGKPVEMVFSRGDWKNCIVDSYRSFESFFTEITKGIYYGGAGEEGKSLYEEKERSLIASGRRVFVIYEKDRT